MVRPTRLWMYTVWPKDAIWRHGTGSTLTQIMTWCVTTWHIHLNQCRPHSLESNLTISAPATILGNELESKLSKLLPHFPMAYGLKGNKNTTRTSSPWYALNHDFSDHLPIKRSDVLHVTYNENMCHFGPGYKPYDCSMCGMFLHTWQICLIENCICFSYMNNIPDREFWQKYVELVAFHSFTYHDKIGRFLNVYTPNF